MDSKKNTEKVVKAALIAALYAVLTTFVAELGFKIIQFRVSEILTILPVFDASAIPGLTLGCVVSNVYGALRGLTPSYDVIIGSLATLISAILTRKFRNIEIFGLPLVSTLPPVIVNAIVIGLESTIEQNGFNFIWGIYFKNVSIIAISQFVICTIGGTLLTVLLKKTLYKNQKDE